MQWMLLVASAAHAVAHDLYCPGVDQFHTELGDVEFKQGGFSMTGDARVSSKTSWNLLGGYVEFDMDTTETQPGIISTFYTTSPEEANCGMACYCDINHLTRPCMEMDLVENNGNCLLATTTHTHATDGVSGNRNCDKWGCASKTPLPGTPVHMKGVFAQDGSLVVYLDGVANNQYHPFPSNASNAEVVETMKRDGAAIVSSQWYSAGWVPGKNDCPVGSQDKLASSTFTVSNLRVRGTVTKGPEPEKCSSVPPSSATTTVITTTSTPRSVITSTSPSSSIATSASTSLTSLSDSPRIYTSTSSTTIAADEVRSTAVGIMTSTTNFAAATIITSSSGSATSTTSTWRNSSSTNGDQQDPAKLLSATHQLSVGLFLHIAFFLLPYF